MAEAEFEIEHDGKIYFVLVSYRRITIDDSFDGHLAGYVYTFSRSHKEPDPDDWEIVSCQNDDEQDVDADDVKGLTNAIWEKLFEQDCD
jgi:hypothetical protein